MLLVRYLSTANVRVAIFHISPISWVIAVSSHVTTENALGAIIGAIFVNRKCSWCDICRQKCSYGGDVERTCGRAYAATKSVLRNRPKSHQRALQISLIVCGVLEFQKYNIPHVISRYVQSKRANRYDILRYLV